MLYRLLHQPRKIAQTLKLVRVQLVRREFSYQSGKREFEIMPNTNGIRVLDLRSDTISQPTQEMRNAMLNAVVGDDVYGEDPTVSELERRSAELLGKQAGLFVPTGTMANLIAIMVHCNRRGSEVIAGDASHTFLFEQAGPAQIAGVQMATVKNKSDGTFCLEEVQSKIRINPDVHEPFTQLIIVENTHNMCGGKILPLDWLENLAEIAKKHKIALHMDGARLFNAAVGSNTPASRIVRDFDSVCFCLSKSLGAPVGSVLVGTTSFINQARRMRKVLGGGMRQSGVIAACGIVALDNMIDRLKDDHQRLKKLAQALATRNSTLFKVEPEFCQTNILMVWTDKTRVPASKFIKRSSTVTEKETNNVHVKLVSRNESWIRFTIYYQITDQDIDLVIEKILFVMDEFENEFRNK